MNSNHYQKEKKIVPRFRRKNENKNLIDADDEEAQALIEKDLQSHFIWTSDTHEIIKDQSFHYDDLNNNQQISINDHTNLEFVYDIDNYQNLWNINIQDNHQHVIKWTNDQDQQNKINFTIENNQDKQQQWSLNDLNSKTILFNLNDKQIKQNFDTTIDQNQQQIFIQGEEFRHQIKFGIESENENLNRFPNDEEDNKPIEFDSNIPSINSILSLPQTPIIYQWIKGISEYTLSLPVIENNQEYSPLTNNYFQIDSNQLKTLKWSLDLLKENIFNSYLISLPNHYFQQYSLPDQFSIQFSIDELNNNQLFDLLDNSFEQTISLSSNDIKNQLLTIIDSIQIKQNFGQDEQFTYYQCSLNQIKTIIQNISPEEFINLLYSPEDVKPIELQQLLIDSDEISARAFRRHRCKHMSIKTDDTNILDFHHGLNLQFKGNEQIAIGEKQIENDLNEQQIFKDLTTNEILLNNDLPPQSYDITINNNSSRNLGPCLYRSDYECEPPSTSSRLRREIGYISFDSSLDQPIYYLNKSFKRYVHIPKDRNKCSYDVYNGYHQFIEKVKLNYRNYFLPFDSTDLRHLLYWYQHKNYLFSLNNSNLLKPPTFICRRMVLRTILANLYCDSNPWKLLVIRIKGQFYLSLANKQTKQPEDITQDEYSGYLFEQLFTTDQPNTTRFNQNISLDKPQQQFHTVQYWQFGKYNILYSNEIDGELILDTQQKTETNYNIKQEDDSTKSTTTTTITTTENKQEKVEDIDWWEGEIPINKDIENKNEEIENELKEAQINENLQLIKNDENDKIEKKKLNEFQLKSGYVEMKCTNKKIFYRDENKLQTLYWWAQMWLANVNTLMIGYKTSNDGIIHQLDLFTIQDLIYKFLSKYNLHLKYCFSYLYSFLNLIEKTILIDDPNTIHAFAYIPQPLDIHPITGTILQMDLPNSVPFRYTQIKRSNKRHSNFMPESYIQHIQRTIPIQQDKLIQNIQDETKKTIGHRGRKNCILKQLKNKQRNN